MYGAGQIVGEIDALLKDNCHFTVTQCSQDSEVYSINYQVGNIKIWANKINFLSQINLHYIL